jgi:hypothetical protein
MLNQTETQENKSTLKINFIDFDAKIISEMAERATYIMDEVEKLNDTCSFSVGCFEVQLLH